jgi:hypothetical protein
MSRLVDDVLALIFTDLQNDPVTLRSCISVNKNWCRIAIPILWNYLSYAYEYPLDKKRETREKVYNVIAHFLPKKTLFKHKILLPLDPFNKEPLFNYLSFFTRLSQYWIEDMKIILIDREVENCEFKQKTLEHEIYKLIFNSCTRVKHFYWCTNIQLYLYANAPSFFSNLRSLRLNLEVTTSTMLLGLAVVCRNIKEIEADYCDEDTSSLVTLIKMQNNLQSLCLYVDSNAKEQYTLLSEAIKEKAENLKRITLKPDITLIPPAFIPLLKNLQYLVLNNDEGDFYENNNWKEWEKYLSKASFTDLRYLETLNIPINIEHLIIEKSGGNLSEINMYHLLEQQNSPSYQSDNKRLINLIYNHCPKLLRLYMDVNPKNLNEIGRIFTNCTQLERVNFKTSDSVFPNGDDLLKIVSNMSSATLQEFTFGDKWNFSVKGLELFFENWKSKNRVPITFIHYNDQWDEGSLWTHDHSKIVEKYMYESVVRF